MKRTVKTVGGMVLAVGLAFLAAAPPAVANNITVTNVALVNQSTAGKTVEVQFDLSWQNSWRDTENWDAAWVFVKFEEAGLPTNNWQHALLSTSGHTPAANSTIAVGTNDASGVGLGAFVYRNAAYTGDVSYANMRLLWNYGSNGYAFAKGASVVVSVQAIEMVHVPQGAFAAGSGGTESTCFTLTTINTGNATVAPSGSGSLGGQAGGYPTGQTAPNNASWPNGYNAFYCMKYELTQGQYRDFLNMLTRAQQSTRTASQAANNYAMGGTGSIQNRESIRCPAVIPGTGTNIVFGCDWNNNGVFNEPGDGMDRAGNFISWSDGCAYAAWAGLRPMTELEFEKACRGPATPVANEYAWGNATAPTVLTSENNDGYGTSTASPANANGQIAGGPSGPCRVGIFATVSSTRAQAGASYWGIMELSGNLWERPVNIGSANGRLFTGSNGSGVLDANGRATNTDWNTDGAGSDASGVGIRGGSWLSAASDARVSDRVYAGFAITSRAGNVTLRAVRGAP